MLKRVINNLRNANKFKGSFSEKFSVFFILNRLYIKGLLFKSKTASDHFFNLKITGPNYFNLNYLFNEIFISNDYYFESSKKEPLIIDCGANIGVSVLYFKTLFPNAKILAFEPNPYAFQLLNNNIKDNNISNIELYNVALYNKETEISFFIRNNIGTLDGSANKSRGGETELKVRAKKLSHYLVNFQEIDLIKMDVEGAEINIINDLFESGYINKAKEYIIEYHHNISGDNALLSSFLQKFEQNGFSYNIKTSYSKKASFQDILICFYRA